MLVLGTYADKKNLLPVGEEDILYHTAIVGQSGSGKSYFLARFLEEIMLRTRARILIIDPNGDFSHFYLGQEKKSWNSEAFDSIQAALHTGQTPVVADYDDIDAFSKSWQERKIAIVQAGREHTVQFRENAFGSPLFLHWKWLESEQDYLLNVNSMEYPNIYQGMNTCIKYAAADFHNFPQGYSLEDLEDIAQQFGARQIPVGQWPEAMTLSDEDWLAVRVHFRQLRKRYYRLWYKGSMRGKTAIPADLSSVIYSGIRWNTWQACAISLAGLDEDHMLLAANTALYRIWKSSVISWQIARQRFAIQLEKEVADVAAGGASSSSGDDGVPTFPAVSEDNEELNSTGSGEWSDQRVPTFVVIDEAHKFAPEEPASSLQQRVSEKIAMIAAEGRKYGVFVVLATQRPQKLRRGLLSECENSAILRIQSKVERGYAAQALNIPSETIEHVSTFTTGTALMHGRWVPAPLTTKFAPARTVLGGGGLDKSFWKHQ